MEPLDKQTQYVLARISEAMPAYLKEHLMKTETVNSEREMAEEMIRDGHLSLATKARLRKAVDSGALDGQKRDILQEDIAQQIDDYYKYRIKDAIEHGHLKPPKKDKYFYRHQRGPQ